MTKEEYDYKMAVIETEYVSAKKDLYLEYARAQRKFKVGDIVKSNITEVIIQVDSFTTSVTNGTPKPVYHGISLRKDLKPKKKGERLPIYGNDMVELIKPATGENN